MNDKIDAVLGKAVNYQNTYNPDILVRIDRKENRDAVGIDSDRLIFTGFDAWHAWEMSFLVQGIPVNGVLKIIIPATSRYTVESKSLKLYLFSFSMQNFKAVSVVEAISIVEGMIRQDLSKLLETEVKVVFHDSSSCYEKVVTSYTRDLPQQPDFLNSYLALGKDEITAYQEDPSLLKLDYYPTSPKPQAFVYDGLRSNCRVTHQPDYGTVYIAYEADQAINPKYLAKYLISFRNENHFHEEIVETIYKRLWDLLKPTHLEVTAFYTRRGGIDICPSRCSDDRNPLLTTLGNPSVLGKEFRS